MGESYGYDVPTLEKKGLTLISKNAEDQNPDAFIDDLAALLKKTKAKRLVIDSLTSFEHMYRDEMYIITKRLASLAREYEVTTIFTVLIEQLSSLTRTDLGISSLFQNILLLRYVEIEGKMRRSLIILKMRSTHHDESIMEFAITQGGVVNEQKGMTRFGGISITGSLEKYVGIITGVAQKLSEEFAQAEEGIMQAQDKAREKRRASFEAGEREIASRGEKESKKRLADSRENDRKYNKGAGALEKRRKASAKRHLRK
jgi:hypothetical protein